MCFFKELMSVLFPFLPNLCPRPKEVAENVNSSGPENSVPEAALCSQALWSPMMLSGQCNRKSPYATSFNIFT